MALLQSTDHIICKYTVCCLFNDVLCAEIYSLMIFRRKNVWRNNKKNPHSPKCFEDEMCTNTVSDTKRTDTRESIYNCS